MDLFDKSIPVEKRLLSMTKDLAKPAGDIKATLTLEQVRALGNLTTVQAGLLSFLQGELIPTFDAEMSKGAEEPNLPEAAYHHLHMTIGINGELGELLDAMKKSIIYCKEMDRENIVEEVGDILFYSMGFGEGFYKNICNSEDFKQLLEYLGVTIEECAEANVNKLVGKNGRYKSGKYSDKQAQDRADKEGK